MKQNPKTLIQEYIKNNKLSHIETMTLIKQYQSTKDEKYKEILVLDNTKLVLAMTKRFRQRVDNIDDLFQVGIIGLIKAIENFNTDYDLRFSTYAVPLIIGEMKRHMRDNSQIKISRTIRDNAYKVLQAKDVFLQENKREPSVEELSKVLDLNKRIVQDALLSTNTIQSFQEEIGGEGGNVTLLDQVASKEKGIGVNQRIDLLDALNILNDKERVIIEKRYFQGESQLEIAKDLFISQAQVSRIEKQALNNLHKYLL